VSAQKIKAGFVEPMLLLRSSELPDDDGWLKELKFDGYRALGIKASGKVELRSRNDNDFSGRYAAIAGTRRARSSISANAAICLSCKMPLPDSTRRPLT
jgi:bifunctional non-homologous end joining protein LigD